MFLYSSRRRHTRWPRVWSSDVCSSDLAVITDTWVSMGQEGEDDRGERTFAPYQVTDELMELSGGIFLHCLPAYRGKERSEERRVGKERESRRAHEHQETQTNKEQYNSS